MSITERQEQILNTLIKEYIDLAEPISSELLKKRCDLDVSPATIRNELQALADKGYVAQPHTSAGRVPTSKAYRYFAHKMFDEYETHFPDFIFKEIEEAKEKIEKELQAARELMESLTEISLTLNFNRLEEETVIEILELLGPSRTTYERNIDLINQLKNQLRNF